MSGISLDMDSLEISPIEIDQVSLSNFNSNFSYSAGELKNTKMKFQVKVDLNYEIKSVKACLFGKCITVIGGSSGSKNLFNYDTGFIDVDTITVNPGTMNIGIPSLTLKFKSDSLKIAPIGSGKKITAEKMEMCDITMDETVIPGSTPALFGGTIPLPNPFGPQNMSVCNTDIKDFSTIGIDLPPMQLENIRMENIKIDKVDSDSFSVVANTTKDSPKITIVPSFVYVWASISIKTTMKADEMVMSNLQGGITATDAQLSGMHIDLKLKDIHIRNLKIDGLDTKEIEVGL